jgi:hypothetical protein
MHAAGHVAFNPVEQHCSRHAVCENELGQFGWPNLYDLFSSFIKMANCLADVHDGLGNLARLPTEMIAGMLKFLSADDLESLALVSARLKTIVVQHAIRPFVRRTGFPVDAAYLIAQLERIKIPSTVDSCMCIIEGLFYLNHEQSIDALGVTQWGSMAWRKGDRVFTYDGHGGIRFLTAGGGTRLDYTSPSFIRVHTSGELCSRMFYLKNKLHRDEDQPAEEQWYENGRLRSVVYSKNGAKHRDNDQPAKIFWRPNGDVESREWWVDGHFVRRVMY